MPATMKVIRQLLYNPDRSADCGPASVSEAQFINSEGSMNPATSDERRAHFLAIRRRGDAPSGPDDPTTIEQLEKAYESFGPAYDAMGLDAPQMKKMVYGSWKNDLLPALKNGGVAVLGVWYPVLWNAFPRKSGQPGARFNHWVLVGNYREENGAFFIDMADPLCDGRRSNIAKGVQKYPAWVVKAAAAGWRVNGNPIGADKLIGGLTKSDLRKNTVAPSTSTSGKMTLSGAMAEISRLESQATEMETALASIVDIAQHADDPAESGAAMGAVTGVDSA